MKCPFSQKINDITLCTLYSYFQIDGKYWANYPDCDMENCPFFHPELLSGLTFRGFNSKE